MNKTNLSWSEYALKYDMLLQYNPFYQELFKDIIARTDRWLIKEGDVILDIGAGTGNYSCAIAKKFPQARVIHIDNDTVMNSIAERKKINQNLENLEVKTLDIDQLNFDENSVKALVSIHSLYTLSEPIKTLEAMHKFMSPGGHGIIVDAGRKVNVLEWQLAICYELIRKYGILQALKIMQEGKGVSRQNRSIRKLQDEGKYWVHTHDEFCQIIKDLSFTVIENKTTFRNISDLVVVTK